MAVVGQTKTYTASNNGTPSGTYGSWSVSPGTAGIDWDIIPNSNAGLSSIQIKWLTASPIFGYTIGVTASNTCSTFPITTQEQVNNVQCLLPPTFVYWGAHEDNTPSQLGALSTGNGYNIDGVHGIAGDSLSTYVNSGAILTVVSSSGITIDSFNENNFTFTGTSLGTHTITATLTCPNGSSISFTQSIIIVLPTGSGDNVFVLNKCIGGFDNVLIGTNSNLTNGTVIVASNGECSTITGTSYSATETKTIINAYSTCNDCQVCTYVKVHNGSSQIRQIDGYGKCGQPGQNFGANINLAPGEDAYICMSRYSVTFVPSTIFVYGFQNIFSSSSSNDNEYFPAAGGVTASYVSGC
jgi:hypothetical protein